ncbi:MAG: DbpA RNA binding domain-containing protein [Treponema sp.]|nr:DbpA RNA binding domain-containing protein [Treponema sp.]MCL2238128.1 DbpA RNA binding domain-containing protein [Treponema sp.]
MDKEKAKRNLESIIDKLHNDTDFSLLKEYKNLFKKDVFFLRRTEVAAWLFMYYDQKETPPVRSAALSQNSTAKKSAMKSQSSASSAKNSHVSNSSGFAEKSQFAKNAADKQPVEINLGEEESKRLFISIGKNRRLFPREVITLIMSKTSTPREDIGMIRILDNYSFVQVRDTKADEIIEALTGHRFRGRTLTVNYAKPKSTEPEEN